MPPNRTWLVLCERIGVYQWEYRCAGRLAANIGLLTDIRALAQQHRNAIEKRQLYARWGAAMAETERRLLDLRRPEIDR